jgi:hypothetical protein
MLLFRFLILICLLSAAVSFALYVGTGQPRYRIWGLKVLKWTLVAALSFFAVLFAVHLAQ